MRQRVKVIGRFRHRVVKLDGKFRPVGFERSTGHDALRLVVGLDDGKLRAECECGQIWVIRDGDDAWGVMERHHYNPNVGDPRLRAPLKTDARPKNVASLDVNPDDIERPSWLQAVYAAQRSDATPTDPLSTPTPCRPVRARPAREETDGEKGDRRDTRSDERRGRVSRVRAKARTRRGRHPRSRRAALQNRRR